MAYEVYDLELVTDGLSLEMEYFLVDELNNAEGTELMISTEDAVEEMKECAK